MKPQCNLIIDSCCDLPVDLVSGDGIKLLQFPYLMNGAQCFDDLFVTGSAHSFYEAMRDGAEPSTAQIPLLEMEAAWREAAESGVPTVFLCFSSGLSGTFDTASLLLDKVKGEYPDAELYLVDTQLASIAEGFLVLEAIRQRALGLTAEQLAAWAEEAKYFVRCVFTLDSFDALQRGGRIPPALAKVGSKLDVKPLLNFNLDGSLGLFGLARGRKKSMRAMIDFYAQEVDREESARPATMGHADSLKDYQKLKDMLRKEDSGAAVVDCVIGPVIGSHVGPGMLALVFWGSDRRGQSSLADRIAQKIKKGK